MWRVIAYPLAALAGIETIIIVAAREAFVWLNVGPDSATYATCMIIGGIAALVVGAIQGSDAATKAEEWHTEQQRIESNQAEERRRIERSQVEAQRKYELDRLKRLEKLAGPDGT